MIVRNLLFGTLTAFFLLGNTPVSAEVVSPTDQVRQAVNDVIALLQRSDLDPAARRQQLRAAIGPHFDFESMSRSILALNWKKASADQRKRFMALFQKLLEDTYITSMEAYAGETVRFSKEKTKDDRATVETFILRPSGVETPVVYRLKLRDGEWLAYDVIVEGVSLVSNYRGSFRDIVKTQGMEALLTQLAGKVSGNEQKATDG